MVGDFGSVSGAKQPRLIDRPYQWAAGGSLPKYYLRTAEQILRSEMRGVKNAVLIVASVTAVMNAVFFVSTLLRHRHFTGGAVAWAIGITAFVGLMLFLIYAAFSKRIGDSCAALQQGSFEWRSGIVDDIGAEVVEYRSDGEGDKTPVIRRYAYADGEALPNPKPFGATISYSCTEVFGKTTLKIRMHGNMQFGSPVMLIRLDNGLGDTQTLILPQSADFSEH